MGRVALGTALALSGAERAAAQSPAVRVVYHLSEGTEQASRALEFIRNHLEADPNAQIVVVGHAAGVDFLVKGAKTAKGNAYAPMVDDFDFQGVKFRVCEITLRERGMRRDQFIKQASFVPSGVAEIARLQSAQGYAYIKP